MQPILQTGQSPDNNNWVQRFVLQPLFAVLDPSRLCPQSQHPPPCSLRHLAGLESLSKRVFKKVSHHFISVDGVGCRIGNSTYTDLTQSTSNCCAERGNSPHGDRRDWQRQLASTLNFQGDPDVNSRPTLHKDGSLCLSQPHSQTQVPVTTPATTSQHQLYPT